MPRVSPQHNSKDTVAGASPSSLSHTLSKHIAGSPANIIPRSSNYTPAPSLTMGAVQNSPSESLCANQAYGAARGHSSPSAAPSPPSPLGLRQRRPANRTGTVESSHFMTPELPSPAPARNPPAAQTSPGLHYQAPQAYPTDSAEASLFIMPEPEPPVPPPNLPPTQTLPQPDPRRRTDSAQPGALGTPDPAVPTPRTSTTTSNQTPLSAASTRRTPSTPTGRRSESRPFIRRVARYGYYEDRLGAYPDVDEDAEGGGVWCSGSDDSDSPVRPWGKRNAVRSRQPAVVSQDTEAAEENGNGAGVEFLRCKAIYDRKVADGKATQEDFVWISGLEADEKRRKEVLEKGKRQRKDDKAAAVPKITRCGMFRRRLGDHVNESSSISLGAEEDSDEEDTPSTTNSPPRPPPPSVRKQYGMFSKVPIAPKGSPPSSADTYDVFRTMSPTPARPNNAQKTRLRRSKNTHLTTTPPRPANHHQPHLPTPAPTQSEMVSSNDLSFGLTYRIDAATKEVLIPVSLVTNMALIHQRAGSIAVANIATQCSTRRRPASTDDDELSMGTIYTIHPDTNEVMIPSFLAKSMILVHQRSGALALSPGAEASSVKRRKVGRGPGRDGDGSSLTAVRRLTGGLPGGGKKRGRPAESRNRPKDGVVGTRMEKRDSLGSSASDPVDIVDDDGDDDDDGSE